MKICGIIFDKDGTLLNFNKFWVSVTDKAIDEILQKCGADISLKPKVLSALGTGIGVGGSVLMSALRGCGKTSDSENMKKSVLFVLTVFGLIASAVLSAICRPLAGLMGARGNVYKYACDYALVISATAVFQIVGSGLIAVLRNENKMFHSMIYTILSLAVHIGLDILLVGKYKLTGVAVSTAVSQFAVLVLCLCTLKIEKSAKINRAYIKDILRASSAPFGVNFVPSLVLFATNYSALKYGGSECICGDELCGLYIRLHISRSMRRNTACFKFLYGFGK